MRRYISSPKRTTEILSDHGIRLSKSLGQNYMIDTNSIKKIVSIAGIQEGENVLEIGSGIGSLTEILLEGGAGRVICVEIDKKVSGAFKDIFSDQLGSGKVELILKDAMDIGYGKLSSGYGIKKMISNLPYKIAAPLILKILREAPGIVKLWVTIQKDIADRLLAGIGDKNYSSYTVKSNLLAEYKQCFKISRNCFLPKPFVGSVVLEIIRKDLPAGFSSERNLVDFFNLVNAAFLHRRKKLLNSWGLSTRYDMQLKSISRLLNDLGKNLTVRAEDLSLEEYIYIFNMLKKP